MTNYDLRNELRELMEGVLSEASKAINLTELTPPSSKEGREEILNGFQICKAKIWADVGRALYLAEEVELASGLTDVNQITLDQIREIHDLLTSGEWPNV